MFQSFVDNYRSRVLAPKINVKMNEVGEAWKAEATRLAPVDTGHLKASIGFTYNAQTKTLNLYADAKYALFQELGTRFTPAHPFMRPALSVVPRIWRGGLGIISGYTTNIQAPNHPAKYHARTAKFTKGKVGGARLMQGAGKFK